MIYIYINLRKGMRKIWEEFYNCIKIISRYFNFCIYIYMNNRCRLSARTPFCAQRRERHKMEDSRFSTSPSSVRADDDDPDKRNLALWWKRGSCGMASRATVFVEVHSDYGLSVACRPLEWKSSSEATFAVPSSLLHHAYVFTLVRRERYFCRFGFTAF